MAKRNRVPVVVVRDSRCLHVVDGHGPPWLTRCDAWTGMRGTWLVTNSDNPGRRIVPEGQLSNLLFGVDLLGDRFDDLAVGEYREAWLEIRT